MAANRIIISTIDHAEFVRYCEEHNIKAVTTIKGYAPQIIDFGSSREALNFLNHFNAYPAKHKIKLILAQSIFDNLIKHGIQNMENISPSQF